MVYFNLNNHNTKSEKRCILTIKKDFVKLNTQLALLSNVLVPLRLTPVRIHNFLYGSKMLTDYSKNKTYLLLVNIINGKQAIFKGALITNSVLCLTVAPYHSLTAP